MPMMASLVDVQERMVGVDCVDFVSLKDGLMILEMSRLNSHQSNTGSHKNLSNNNQSDGHVTMQRDKSS
jgi:hypothetical protein